MKTPLEVVIINGRKLAGACDPTIAYPGAALWTNGRHIEPGWNWTAHFDMHPIARTDFYPGIAYERPHVWSWYCEQPKGRPIYLVERRPEVPAAEVFPRRDVQLWAREWNSGAEFRTSVDWMLAFAGYRGAKLVVLYNVGANVSSNMSWLAQHGAGIAYWIAALRFLKIEVRVEGPSVFAPPADVYGYEHAGARHGYRVVRSRRVRQ